MFHSWYRASENQALIQGASMLSMLGGRLYKEGNDGMLCICIEPCEKPHRLQFHTSSTKGHTNNKKSNVEACNATRGLVANHESTSQLVPMTKPKMPKTCSVVTFHHVSYFRSSKME